MAMKSSVWAIVAYQVVLLSQATLLRQASRHHSEQAGLQTELDALLQLRPSLPSAKHRPVLTVELMGGLGNQLFQVAALISTGLALSPKFSIALPDLPGVCCNRSTYWHSVLKNLQPVLVQGLQAPAPVHGQKPSKPARGKCLVEQTPGFDPYDEDCSDATAFSPNWVSSLSGSSGCNISRLYGYFQHPAFFSKHLQLLRHIFWDPASAAKAQKMIDALLPGGGSERPIVSVHYRLGDYDSNGWVLDSDYYDAALLEVARRLAPRRPRCLIFSDEPKRAWERSATLEGCEEKVLAKAEDTATSFHMMSLAQASITADSTFSYWAAVLGKSKEVVVTPALEGRQKACWSYLKHPPLSNKSWVQVPARALSSQELFAQDILAMASPPDN